MLALFLAFIAGMLLMDVMWAIKLGIPQAMYYAWKHRNDPVQPFDFAEE